MGPYLKGCHCKGLGRLLLLLFLSGVVFPGYTGLLCQNPGSHQQPGLKIIKNYSRSDYGFFLHPQNWRILQDRRGIIYVANHAALLEFDSVTWRLIKVPNWTVRSLALDETGRLYLGGNNEIGYLAPDDNGTLNYVSLLEQVPQEKRNFASVWRCHEAQGQIYFLTSKLLMRWNPKNKQLKTWETGSTFNTSFVYKDTFCLQVQDLGLLHMVDDSLELLPGTQTLARQKIYFTAPYDTPSPGSGRQKLLVGTREKGLFLYDGSKTQAFPSEADLYLNHNQLSHGIRLAATPGEFALSTLKGGVVIIDSAGRLKRIFNKTTGLLSNNVKHVYEDTQGNLWLALDKGIAKIEYATSFSVFDETSGLSGNFLSLVKYGPASRENYYVGTTDGLYVLADSQRFRPVKEMTGACWAMLPVKDLLLVASRDGVFQFDRQFKQKIPVTEEEAFTLYPSRRWPQRVWVGTASGLTSLHLENNRWKKELQFETINERIRSIAEDNSGNLWLGTLTQGTIKVEFPGDTLQPLVTRFNTSPGLPGLPPGEIYAANAAGHIMFATEKGLYRFDETRKAFQPDPTLGNKFCNGSRQVFRLVEDKNRQIWFYSRFRNFQAIPGSKGTYTLDAAPFRQFPITQVNSIYPDPDGQILWFVGNDSIIRYDTAFKKDYQKDFPVLIRSVTVNGTDLLFNGYLSSGTAPSPAVLDSRQRNLHFEFATPFFAGESETKYQWLLDGYDRNWSEEDMKSHAIYTNLDPGRYTFRVRARNVYEHLSTEAQFHFRILPPWTKTWWAFSLYILTGILSVYGIVRWRSRQLRREKFHLEQVVKDRTGEIKEKNTRLELQSRQLQELDEMKSRFFANLSHEFRTPLTLIMGPLEQMLANARDKEQRKKIASMYRHSRRLLSLISQLLDLAKFDSGKMKLKAVCRDIVSFLKDICASFELLAAQHKIELRFTAAEETIELYFDPERLEQVIANLLLNAVKFTPAGGAITLTVTKNNKNESGNPFSMGWSEISVRDTGTGIPLGQMAYIFDRFYQAGNSAGPGKGGGTGIGLALVKEWVSLHHGEIDVQVHGGEEEQPGTEFIIRLPLGNAHLLPGEIAVEPETPSTDRPQFNLDPLHLPGTEENRQERETRDEPADEPVGKAGRGDKEIILVVDDSADLRCYIKSALQADYLVEEAYNGEDGIRKAKKIIPDLIISDVVMPGMDGYRLCAILKNEIGTSHIPVILLTARAAEENILQGLETGADDYVTKPFSTKLLLVRVRNLIQLRRQLQLHLKRELKLQPAAISVSKLDREFIKELLEVIDKNLSNPDFTVEILQKKLYMSRSTLYRKIHALSGESPVEFIRSYRLKRAAQLLGTREMSITDVAFRVGFSSSAYFTKCFKEQFHQVPSVYQGSNLRDN